MDDHTKPRVTVHTLHTRLVNDRTGTRSVLFEHMQDKTATVLTSIKEVDTLEGARTSIEAFEDLSRTLEVLTKAFRSYDESSGEEE